MCIQALAGPFYGDAPYSMNMRKGFRCITQITFCDEVLPRPQVVRPEVPQDRRMQVKNAAILVQPGVVAVETGVARRVPPGRFDAVAEGVLRLKRPDLQHAWIDVAVRLELQKVLARRARRRLAGTLVAFLREILPLQRAAVRM